METNQNLFHHFLLLYPPFIKELNKKLAEHNLYSSLWSIIFYMNKYETINLVEIANYLNREKPTITREVHRLQELNYIVQIHGENKREKRIKLTQLGKKVCSDIQKTLDDFQEHLRKGVTDQDLEDIIRVMGTIRGNLTE